MKLLRLSDNTELNSTFATSRSIITDECSVRVKVASSMEGCHHCLYAFHGNQLAILMSYLVI